MMDHGLPRSSETNVFNGPTHFNADIHLAKAAPPEDGVTLDKESYSKEEVQDLLTKATEGERERCARVLIAQNLPYVSPDDIRKPIGASH